MTYDSWKCARFWRYCCHVLQRGPNLTEKQLPEAFPRCFHTHATFLFSILYRFRRAFKAYFPWYACSARDWAGFCREAVASRFFPLLLPRIAMYFFKPMFQPLPILCVHGFRFSALSSVYLREREVGREGIPVHVCMSVSVFAF